MKYFILVFFLAPQVLLAQDGSADLFFPPDWLLSVMTWAYDIPMVGPIVVEASKWAGFITAMLTAVSVFLIGVSKACASIEKLLSIPGYMAPVIYGINKIMPYVKYLSMFNVQKK